MATCHYNTDSASPPCPSLHSGMSGESKEIPVMITGFAAALTKATTPVPLIYVLIGEASAYVGHSDCLRRRTEHSTVSGGLASPIPTSII